MHRRKRLELSPVQRLAQHRREEMARGSLKHRAAAAESGALAVTLMKIPYSH
jgi:hypothetical protein